MLTRRLTGKLLALTVLTFALVFILSQAEVSRGTPALCDPSVYEFCWSQGRVVNPETCECNYQSCLGLTQTDCAETGGSLDYDTCKCQPGDLLPWCPPNIYQTCMNQGKLVNPINCQCWTSDIPGGGTDMPLCSFASYTWCANTSGAWQGWNCNCGFMDTNNNCTANSTLIQACQNSGGTWNTSQCLCDY